MVGKAVFSYVLVFFMSCMNERRLKIDDVRREILLKIRESHKFKLSKEAVLYYLRQVYPDPKWMDLQEREIYYHIEASLKKFLED